MQPATRSLISIIVGLGLTKLLGNSYRLVRDRKRVAWDALPLAWSAFLLLFVLNYWWTLVGGVAGWRQVTSVAGFALLLAQPLLLFFACSAALPRFEAGQELDNVRGTGHPAGQYSMPFEMRIEALSRFTAY